VLSAHIFSCFERTNIRGFSMNRLWDHAVRSGLLARMIMRMERAEPSEAEDAYTGGMLHDIGKLMLAHSLPEKFQQTLQRMTERNSPFYEVETEVFGATHAGAAGYLLGLWGLPAPIVEAVAFHHHPERSDLRTFGPLTAVHVANVLEHELARTDPERRLVQINHDYIAAIGCEHRIADWRAEAARMLGTQSDS
jgi:HD-like signal output (HDOD) protein